MNQPRPVTIFKALADETRLGIVNKLAQEGGKSAVKSCDILACASITKLSQPAMSHHFAKLVESGVLREHRNGTEKAYSIDRELLESVGIDITKL